MTEGGSPRASSGAGGGDRLERILSAGWDLFRTNGVERTALDAIAAAAGVPRAELARYFPEKGSLLEAAVAREMRKIEAAQLAAWDFFSPDVRTTLRQFGYAAMAVLLSPATASLYTVLAGELQRNAALARRFYDAGPGRTRENLASLIRRAAERGDLDAPDPVEAAEHLFGMWQGFSNFQLALGGQDAPDMATLRRRVDAAVDRFLLAYGTRRPTDRDRPDPRRPGAR